MLMKYVKLFENWLDLDYEEGGILHLIAAAADHKTGGVSTDDWIQDFDNYYGTSFQMWGDNAARFRLEYASGDYMWRDFSVEMDDDGGMNPSDQKKIGNLLKDGWEVSRDGESTQDKEEWYFAILKKKLAPQEKTKQSGHILKFLKKNKDKLNDAQFTAMYNLLDEKDRKEASTAANSRKYGI